MVTDTKKKKVTKKSTKKKVARKTGTKNATANLNHGHCKFDVKLIPVIKNLAYRGKTFSGIAELLDISDETFRRWRKSSPELRGALEEAVANPLKNVEAALYERAMGFSCVETKTHLTKSGTIKTRNVTKHYPPSETAQKYFLGNKDPKNWKEKREVTIDDKPNRNLSLAFSTDEDPDDLDARGGDEPGE